MKIYEANRESLKSERYLSVNSRILHTIGTRTFFRVPVVTNARFFHWKRFDCDTALRGVTSFAVQIIDSWYNELQHGVNE